MRKRILALVAALALTAACTEAENHATAPSAGPTTGPWSGGTLRMQAWFRSVPILDPPTSYIGGIHWELYRCCLLRTLMSYNGRTVAEGGAEALPDLAEATPDVSSDGLTWTFHLREGLRYAPPFEDTEIVAQDVVRALERVPAPGPGVYEYGFYYSVIEGFDEFRAGEVASISGLETPDPHTLVVRLAEQAGDLSYRFTMPATAPVPPGAADGHEGEYFRFLVSSGPYMIEGSEDLDFSLPPDEQRPVSGFTPQTRIDTGGEVRVGLTLVRNPSWDPATDSLRGAYVDRIELVAVPTVQWSTPPIDRRFIRELEEGSVDLILAGRGQWEAFRSDPGFEDRISLAPYHDLRSISMNLAVPPLDDVHVRRAVNLAIDKAELAARFTEYWAGQTFASPTAHLLPDALAGGLILPEWRPSWAEGVDHGGDLAAAKREMALSAYDHDGDGRCDDAVCGNVSTLIEKGAFGVPYPWFGDLIGEALARLGIHLDERRVGCMPATVLAGQPENRFGLILSMCTAQAADYLNGSNFALLLWHGDSLSGEATANASRLGASDDQLRAWGYEVTSVPSVDDRIDRCMATVGIEQTECWAELDRYLMEEVVPDVPLFTTSRVFLLSERVAEWSYSEFGVRPAFDRIALVPGSE